MTTLPLILILILTNIVSFIFLVKFINKNKKIKSKNKKIKKSFDKIASIEVGSRAIFECYLKYPRDEVSLFVVYEVEIIETTKKKAKVKVISFKTDSYLKYTYSKGITLYLNNKWISIKSLDLITSDISTKRNLNLYKLGIK